MLLFHIVLSASSPSQDINGSLTEATKNVVGYDGRIRHVSLFGKTALVQM